jgi:Arc/MetJ family transcription regulator
VAAEPVAAGLPRDIAISPRYAVCMSRTIVDIDDEMLARAQRALGTTTKRDTVNAALEVAAAMDADRRARALDSFRDLLDLLDADLIEQDERDDHNSRTA